MRITLDLDPDVAEELLRLRRGSETDWKSLINEVLRLGLRSRVQQEESGDRKPFQTRSVSLGKPLVPIDNVAQLLAYSEGEVSK